MTNGRVYQPAVPAEEARAELARCSGKQFDERVVEAFLRLPAEAPVLSPEGLPIEVPASVPSA